MNNTFNLTARQHTSGVLGNWLAHREGAAVRAGLMPGISALGENTVTTNLSVDQLASALGAASTTASGVSVDENTAMKVTTVYGCVSLIAGTISTLPLPIYQRDGETRKRVDHDYWWMLNEQANDDITTCTAFEFMVMSRLLYGDGFAQLLRASPYSPKVVGWKPLHPNRVQPFRDGKTGDLYYRITPAFGGEQYVLDPADMLHVPSLGFNGLRSPSPITYNAREAVGTALAAEEFTSRFFSQGATFDIALKTAGKLSPEQAEALRTSYLARNGGNRNNRIPLVLAGGLEVEKLSITPADAALLPSRMFTVEELCRVFGVPPFMVGHTDKVSSWGTGVEQMGIGFVKYTLRRHLTPIEQEFNRKLWPSRAKYFVEYNTSALERGDYKTRMEGYRIGMGRAGERGWLAPNEIRKFENMEPVDGGDQLSTGQKDQPTDAPTDTADNQGTTQ
jgi:HK97 family phage portal protein